MVIALDTSISCLVTTARQSFVFGSDKIVKEMMRNQLPEHRTFWLLEKYVEENTRTIERTGSSGWVCTVINGLNILKLQAEISSK
jgi:hypothetical protein